MAPGVKPRPSHHLVCPEGLVVLFPFRQRPPSCRQHLSLCCHPLEVSARPSAASSVPGEGWCPGLQMATLSLCAHQVGGQSQFCVSSWKGSNPVRRVPPEGSNQSPSTSFPNTIHWEFGFQSMNLGRTQTLGP